jgi:hypothetical protein
MTTVRVCVKEAMRAIKALGPGDDPTADELAIGLEAAQNLVTDIHNARGAMFDIDVSGPYTPGENQRVRIAAGSAVAITLPNAISLFWTFDPYDYGFVPGYPGLPPAGSTGAADNIEWRAPRDGVRVEIVGTAPALFFYRSDLNQWMPAYGLTVDTEIPFNTALTRPFQGMLAERLVDVLTVAPPTPTLLKRFATSRTAMFLQSGRDHTRRVGEYL